MDIFVCKICSQFHQVCICCASAPMKWVLVCCRTSFCKVNLKYVIIDWVLRQLSVKWNKIQAVRFSEFLLFIGALCPQYVSVKLRIKMGIQLSVLHLFILAGSWHLVQFFAYFTHHYPFFLTLRVSLIFIRTCIFVSAPSCSLFLIIDHVTYCVDSYTRRKHLRKL